MYIPQVSDLLNVAQQSNGSASMNPGENPVNDFIQTLTKYASPVVKPVVNEAKALPGQAMAGINAAGKFVGNQPLGPTPLLGPKSPTLSQTADFINGTNSDTPIGLPGIDLLHGQGTPMTLLGLAMLGHGAENPEDVATTAEDIAGKTEEGLPPIEEAAPKAPPAGEKPPAPQKPPMITKNRADPYAIAKMQLNFDVPRRIAQNMQVKPDVVMNQIAEDGVSARNLDELQNVVDSVTGEKGAFPTINNHILQNIKDPIGYGDAIKSRTTELPKVLEGETPGFINQINKEVNQAFKPVDYQNNLSESGVQTKNPITGEVAGIPESGKAYAPDLFQVSQNLRTIQRMYMRKAYTDMGELNHPEYERAAQALGEIKNNVDDAISAAVPEDAYQQMKSDPFVQQQLQRVPPNVARRWLQGATSFKDGQTIQAPYVNLGNMIEDTKDTQLSVWTKAAKAMQGQNGSGGFGQTIKENIPGPKIVKNIAGGVAEAAAKPFDKSPEDIFEENMKAGQDAAQKTAGESAGMKPGTGKAAKVIAGLGLAGAAGAGLEAMQHGSNAQSDNHANNGDNGHNGSVSNSPLSVNSQIETDISKIDPSKPAVDPRQVTGTDGKSLAMSDAQYQTAKASLDALVKQDPSYITNPIKAGQLKAANDAIDTKYSASQKLMDSYNKVSTVLQKVQDAQDLLTKTSPVITDKVGFLEGAHEIADPKYQSLVNDLNFIENSDPRLKGQLSNLGTKDTAKTALESVAKFLLSQHNQLLKSYGAGNGATPTPTPVPTTATGAVDESQIPAGLPAPVNGAVSPIPNGAYQFTAPNPLFQ